MKRPKINEKDAGVGPFFKKINLILLLQRERLRERERSREERVSGGGDRDHVSLDEEEDLSQSSSLKRERQDSYEGRSHNGSPIGGANIRIANRG